MKIKQIKRVAKIEAFIKNYFVDRTQKEVPNVTYEEIKQISDVLTHNKKKSNFIKEIYELIDKLVRCRLRRIEKLNDNLIEEFIKEYVWEHKMVNEFVKIFYGLDCMEDLREVIDDKMTYIILLRRSDVVNSLVEKIFNKEIVIELSSHVPNPFYFIFQMIRHQERTEHFIEEIKSSLVIRYSEFILQKCKNIKEVYEYLEDMRSNEVISDYIHQIEKSVVEKIIEHINVNYLYFCISYQKDIEILFYLYELIGRKHILDGLIVSYVAKRYEKKYNDAMNKSSGVSNKHTNNFLEMSSPKSVSEHKILFYIYKCIGSSSVIEKLMYSGYKIFPLKTIENFYRTKYFDLRKSMQNNEMNLDILKNFCRNVENIEEQVMYEIEIIDKLCNLRTDSSNIEDVSEIFIDLYAEYLEYMSYKSISDKLLKNIVDKINRNTLMCIDSLTYVLDNLLKGKIKPSNVMKLISFREMVNLDFSFRIENLFNEERDFEGKKIKKPVFNRLICKNLLDPYTLIKDKIYVRDEYECSEEFILRSIFIFISTVFMLFEDKEILEKKIRENLSIRLLTKTYVNLELEKEFINTMKNICKYVYVYKMEDILNDFKDRKIFRNSEILFLRTFQWPNFVTNRIEIEELEDLKDKYTNNILVHEKRKVKWIDYLSSVDLEIGNFKARISLIQYKIILNILRNKPILENPISEEERRIYEEHLEELIGKEFLVIRNNRYVINSSDREASEYRDYVPKKCYLKNDPSVDKEVNDNKYKLCVLDCRIMKEVKKTKEISLFELKGIIDCDAIVLKSRILDLEKKGYLELKNDVVCYAP